jgi:N-sulfoglucosamine sulfohydrolase
MNHTLLLLAVVLLAPLARLAAAESKPNVRRILSDDRSSPHVGCYGNKDRMTPNLDRFAAEGMRLDRASRTSPQGMPSHVSIFTGRSPVALALSRFSAPLPREITTYPEALQTAGGFPGVAGRMYHRDGANVNVAESQSIFDRRRLVTFPGRRYDVKTGNGRALSPSQRRHCQRPGPTSRPIPFTIL